MIVVIKVDIGLVIIKLYNILDTHCSRFLLRVCIMGYMLILMKSRFHNKRLCTLTVYDTILTH